MLHKALKQAGFKKILEKLAKMVKTTFQRAAQTLCTIVALSLPTTASADVFFNFDAGLACRERHVCKYPAEIKHQVKAGENLWDIARQYYGIIGSHHQYDNHYPTAIARFNHRKVSDYLHDGETIELPKIGKLSEQSEGCCY